MAALSALLAELQSGDPSRAEQAASALAKHGELALQELIHLMGTSDANLRWWVVRALSEFSQEQAGELLVSSLSDPDLAVRQCAALGLSRRPQAAAIRPLLGLLGSPDSLLARLSANALVSLGSQAVPGLLEILEQESPQAKAEAVRALALIGDTRAIPMLFKNIESDSALVEHWASAGLAKMGVGMNFYET